MARIAHATFDVTGWDQEPYGDAEAPPLFSRARVRKAFSGDLEGESDAELLMCQADPQDLSAGAGYVASERFRGTLDGRSGSFVLQHGGLSGGGAPPRTFGNVVPGSATGQLAGLSGTVEISVDEEEAHTLTLAYELSPAGEEARKREDAPPTEGRPE